MIGLILAAQLAGAQNPGAADLNWLAGYWLSCSDGREVAEIWTDARGGTLFNTTVNRRGDRVSSERTMMASVEGRLSFVFEPTGARTVFPLISLERRRAVFENPANDFPQRVIYARDGDVLTGRIEGTIDGHPQAMEWVYQSADLNARCPES